MGYYLLDNPPRSPQFHTSRANAPTWAVSVHTSEGQRDAAALAGFIARRTDPGSYATIVDADTTIDMVPPEFTTFSVAASGYKPRTYAVCIAGRSSDLSGDDPYTLACIDRLGQVIANLWAWVGVDAVSANRWVGTDALDVPGLFCHGDVQPWDRSDAWSVHPDRGRLDALLVDAVRRHSNPEDEVKQSIMWDKRGAAWHCCGNTRVALTSPAQVNVLKFFGVPEIGTPGAGGVEDVVLETMAIVPGNGGTFTPGR
jgi:hypothetical protein